MLSDLSYMREPQSKRGFTALAWLISVILGAFIVQIFASSSWLHGDPDVTTHLAVTISGLRELRFWTIGTYSLLHSTDNLVHIFGVVGGLFLLGRGLIPVLGAPRFLGVYFGAVALGAVVWAAVNWEHGGVLIGPDVAQGGGGIPKVQGAWVREQGHGIHHPAGEAKHGVSGGGATQGGEPGLHEGVIQEEGARATAVRGGHALPCPPWATTATRGGGGGGRVGGG
jgi:hypothetical protein